MVAKNPNENTQLKSTKKRCLSKYRDSFDAFTSKKWKDRSWNERILFIFYIIFMVIILLVILYIFVVSLDLMTNSFRLIAGKATNGLFEGQILGNPVVGLMIGVVVTVVVQSSSTSTSIIVSMVAAGILKVKRAIPVIMGANIGTSVTSTLVAFGQVADKDKFKLSFAGATVHDMFNILSVLVLLPIELLTGYLEIVTGLIVGNPEEYNATTFALANKSIESLPKVDFLKVITDPLTKLIVEVDSKILEELAVDPSCCDDKPLVKHACRNTTNVTCKSLFENAYLDDWAVGLILLIISLSALIGCLLCLVKLLSSLFKGSMGKALQKGINSDLPGGAVGRYFTGYIALFIGCLFTMLVQSSSVFTSSLIPLVGLGLVDLERIFPLTLGSNIGTTLTGILAAFAASGDGPSGQLKQLLSLQIALCHTFFNITGILVWYPVPFLRKLPLYLARSLGEIAADYRWIALVYLIGVFLVIPLFLFGLSVAGDIAFYVVFGFIAFFLIIIIILNLMQTHVPRFLPKFLRNWNFLPLAFHSFEPYDRIFKKIKCCNRHAKVNAAENDDNDEDYEKLKEIVTDTSNQVILLKKVENTQIEKNAYADNKGYIKDATDNSDSITKF